MRIISASSEVQPSGRGDHFFTWERLDFQAEEATLRLSVSVYGDQIGAYDYHLKTPEAFWREYDQQRYRAGFINNFAFVLGFALFEPHI